MYIHYTNKILLEVCHGFDRSRRHREMRCNFFTRQIFRRLAFFFLSPSSFPPRHALREDGSMKTLRTWVIYSPISRTSTAVKSPASWNASKP